MTRYDSVVMIPGASGRGELIQQGTQPHHDCITSRAIAIAHGGYVAPLHDVAFDPDRRDITAERDDLRGVLRQICRGHSGNSGRYVNSVFSKAGNDMRR